MLETARTVIDAIVESRNVPKIWGQKLIKECETILDYPKVNQVYARNKPPTTGVLISQAAHFADRPGEGRTCRLVHQRLRRFRGASRDRRHRQANDEQSGPHDRGYKTERSNRYNVCGHCLIAAIVKGPRGRGGSRKKNRRENKSQSSFHKTLRFVAL